jgi:hypothetical protein
LACGVLTPSAGGARADFVIGQNFSGTNSNQSVFFPPDSDGAIGPNNRFVEIVNGAYAVYNTTNGSLVGSRISQDTFWTNAGVSLGGASSGDPHVMYDASTGHWFAVAIDNLTTNNHVLVAVSNSSDPTAGWKGFALQENNGRFNDFPMLGMNKDALTVGTNDFNGTNPDRVSLLVVPKADLIAGSVANAKFLNTFNPSVDPTTTGFSAHPVQDFDNTSGKNSVLSAFNDTSLKLSTITNTNTTTTGLNTTGGFMASSSPSPTPAGMGLAHQAGTTTGIADNDNRFSANVIQVNGQIWAVQTVQNGTYAALRWFRIDPSTQTILETGLISATNRDYYFGSIAVNASGNIVIGFTGSSDQTNTGYSGHPSSFAVAGQFNGTTTTFGTAVLLQDGSGTYVRNDSSGYNRWGDYSQTTIDPNNPNSFWTIQEFALATNVWSTQITQLIFAPAAAPEPGSLTLVALAAAGATGYYWRRRKAAVLNGADDHHNPPTGE